MSLAHLKLSIRASQFRAISMVGSLAVSLAYGLPVQRRRDELVELIDSIARMVGEQLVPGKAIVDVLPWLRHVPDWVPGMGFKRFAKSVRWMATKFRMEGYERAMKAFVRAFESGLE